MLRYKIKEIICENPESVVKSIKVLSKSGETIATAKEGTVCFGNITETISFTFHDNLYLEQDGDNYFLVRE